MSGKRILVIKHGALGDVIQGLDAYASLREGHKGDHLAVLTSPAFAGLFKAMPYFDEVLVDPRASALNILATLRIRRMFHAGWNRIYDFQSSSRTARYFAHLVPANVETVGRHDGASHPLPDMSALNNRDRMLRTAMLGGCPETTARTDWLAQKSAPSILPDMSSSRPLAVLIPGCSPAKPEKRWAAGHYAELAAKLAADGVEPVLVGTSLDRAVGEEIMTKAAVCHNLIGKTSLTELASLLVQARYAVGNDTGPVFMAARLGTPTLMVMSQHTDPAMSAPYGPHATWLRDENIDRLTADQVYDHLKKMIPAA